MLLCLHKRLADKVFSSFSIMRNQFCISRKRIQPRLHRQAVFSPFVAADFCDNIFYKLRKVARVVFSFCFA